MPEIGHAFGEMGGGYSRGVKVFPAKPLQAYVIDTFAGVEACFQGGDSKRGGELTWPQSSARRGDRCPCWNAGHRART